MGVQHSSEGRVRGYLWSQVPKLDRIISLRVFDSQTQGPSWVKRLSERPWRVHGTSLQPTFS